MFMEGVQMALFLWAAELESTLAGIQRGREKKKNVPSLEPVNQLRKRLFVCVMNVFGSIFPTLKLSSCCAFARAASCFILHVFFPPLPWRDGLFIIYFSLWYKNKNNIPFILLPPQKNSALRFLEQQYRIINAADVCKRVHDFSSLPAFPHSYCCYVFKQMRDFILSIAATDDSSENYDSKSFLKTLVAAGLKIFNNPELHPTVV